VQRAASTITTTINNRVWNQAEPTSRIEPGFASAPDLTVAEDAPGQAMRTDVTRALVLRLAATLAPIPDEVQPLLRHLESSLVPIIRLLAAESRLSDSYAHGAASGFVLALVAFDRAVTLCSIAADNATIPIAAGQLDRDAPAVPERWFGLLTAAVICAGQSLPSHAEEWLRNSTELLGPDAGFSQQLRLLIDGLTCQFGRLRETIAKLDNPPILRIGAAVRLHMEAQSAAETCYFQQFCTSALVSDESSLRQEIYNRHVAIRFVQPWRRHVEHQFQFYTPKASVPTLSRALDRIESESGTLRSLLEASSAALRLPLGDYFARVK
jgi:hypothetical protein